ncbi:MAG: cell division protein FtsZ [Chlorobi bacterium]|nr:cell division protein FtsZ [Chlorobiota bacterium]
MIELDHNAEMYSAKLKVVGVGGGGGNAINSMIARGLEGCEFVAVNTDAQALSKNQAPHKVQIGKELTRGLGAGANPDIGRDASIEDRDELSETLSGADMVFVTAGMGGGTGTGGAPIVAEVARQQGGLVVGIVTRPFNWEGKPRQAKADQGIEELREHVDTLIVVPNQRLLSIIDNNTSLQDAFRRVDDVLYNATSGIARIITGQGYINVDFADVRTIMQSMGEALMGTGMAAGDDRAVEAAQSAISSPLLEGVSISGSQGVLINIVASSSLTMMEIDEAVDIVYKSVGQEANIIFGVVIDEALEDKMMVTVIATGFNRKATAKKEEGKKQGTSMPFRAVGFDLQRAETADEMEQKIPESQPNVPLTPTEEPEEYVANNPGTYKKYDVPAYERRNVSHEVLRGGFDIPKHEEAEDKQEIQKEQEAQRPCPERAAFLRRIMD